MNLPLNRFIDDSINCSLFVNLKSLSPIHFVKIPLSNFLDNEFLVKMYKLKQNYTCKIDIISKIMSS